MSQPSAVRALTIFRNLSALACLLAVGMVSAQEGMAMRHVVRQGEVTLAANPLTAAARTAFYAARGFTAEMIQPYAQACGLSFGMQNHGASTVSTRLADWQAAGADGKRIALRLPEVWEVQWEQAGVPQAARIAFKWAQFQAENTFEPGDWIMGMATLASKPPAPFRLIAHYRDHKGNHEIVLDSLECASE